MLVVVDHVLELMDEYPRDELHRVGRRNPAGWIRRQSIEDLGAIRAHEAWSEVSSEEVAHHHRAPGAAGDLGHPIGEENEYDAVAVDVRLTAECRDIDGVKVLIESGADLVNVRLGVPWGRRRIVEEDGHVLAHVLRSSGHLDVVALGGASH